MSFVKTKKLTYVKILSIIFISIYLLNIIFSLPKANSQNNEDTYRQLTLFGDVFQRVRTDYVEEITDKELIEAAINGMLTSLDPHSSYVSDESFEKMKVNTSGKFGGLGIEVTMENGFVKVVSPIDDTPAAKAGIQPEDLILSVDKESIVGLNLSEAVDKLRGPIGSEVIITIQRKKDEPFEVKIIRDEIKISSVKHKLFDSIGYIRIKTFTEQTSPGIQKSIKELFDESDNKLHGIIIDLRNNPGGLLSEAVKVTDTFLEKGEIVSTRGRDKNNITHAYAKPGDLTNGLPIVVLINEGSASASEIVAGALKDHKRAVLMGTRSFGKGSVQTIVPMPGHGAIRLTTARYFTPSGVSIQAKGIEPDIEVAMAKIEKLDGSLFSDYREEDLRGALDKNQKEEEKLDENETEKSEDLNSTYLEDYLLSRALDLLNGLKVYQSINSN